MLPNTLSTFATSRLAIDCDLTSFDTGMREQRMAWDRTTNGTRWPAPLRGTAQNQALFSLAHCGSDCDDSRPRPLAASPSQRLTLLRLWPSERDHAIPVIPDGVKAPTMTV
jgi:hypothetical protein